MSERSFQKSISSSCAGIDCYTFLGTQFSNIKTKLLGLYWYEKMTLTSDQSIKNIIIKSHNRFGWKDP